MNTQLIWRRMSTAMVITLIAGTAWAGEISNEDPLVKLAVARAKAEATLRDASPVFEPRSAFHLEQQKLERLHERIMQGLNHAREQEDAKGDNRNEQMLHDLNDRTELLEATWQELQQGELGAMAVEMDRATNQLEQLRGVLAGLREHEGQWQEAELDLGALEVSYAALQKRAQTLHALADKDTAAILAQGKAWETLLKDAETLVGTKLR